MVVQHLCSWQAIPSAQAGQNTPLSLFSVLTPAGVVIKVRHISGYTESLNKATIYSYFTKYNAKMSEYKKTPSFLYVRCSFHPYLSQRPITHTSHLLSEVRALEITLMRKKGRRMFCQEQMDMLSIKWCRSNSHEFSTHRCRYKTWPIFKPKICYFI